MKQFHSLRFSTALGRLELSCSGHEILSVSLLDETAADQDETFETAGCPVCRDAARQIREYLSEQRRNFHVPVRFGGNRLQTAVWRALERIPYGETVSYSELARMVGCKSVRAVGTAVGQNPLPILIPCHRVIRKSGAIGEYGLGGPSVKRFLLALERRG